MTRLISARLGAPSRALELARRKAVDELAGRTVWFATALTGGRGVAQTLLERFDRVGAGDVAVGRVEMAPGEPLEDLAGRLAVSGSPFGAAERELCATGVESGEGWVGDAVAADDVVVLQDPLSALLAQAVRERGAHAVWYVTVSAPREAVDHLRSYLPALDAYVVASTRWVAALMPAADVMARRELTARGAPARDVAWGSVLADVVHGDRAESVGGRHHARPAVPVR